MPIGVDAAPLITIRSDKDIHFTGAIAQNAREDENIATGMKSSHELWIESITIISDQNLEFDLYFFSKDTFSNADLDLDAFIDVVNFPVSAAKQIAAAGSYYYTSAALSLPYKDLDATAELHISLVNRSATGKNAGATGEVVVIISARPVYFS